MTNTVPTTLYFNPEWDFLFFSVDIKDACARPPPYAHTALATIHDIRAWDPDHVGVLNLALDSGAVLTFAGVGYSVEDLGVECADAFVGCLRGLREMIWRVYREANDEEIEIEGLSCCRRWWWVVLLGWDVVYEARRMPRESVLGGRGFPEWEQQLYRVLREGERVAVDQGDGSR